MYRVTEFDVVEIKIEQVNLGKKLGERHKVTIFTNSGTIELYLTDEQLGCLQLFNLKD